MKADTSLAKYMNASRGRLLNATILDYQERIDDHIRTRRFADIYRLLTGGDDAQFCRRVSEALDLDYVLYGSPAIALNGENAVVAQAVVWPEGASGPEPL